MIKPRKAKRGVTPIVMLIAGVAAIVTCLFNLMLKQHHDTLELLHLQQEALEEALEEATQQNKNSEPKKCTRAIPPRPIKRRQELPRIAEELGLKTGIEIGVQKGLFSHRMLSRWKSCERYHLIDPWASQEEYNDEAKKRLKVQRQDYQRETKERLKPWENKTTFHKAFSKDAVSEFEQESIDYIYIDGRHDYCAVKEDLELYWPILKPGGIMAGNDFMNNAEVQEFSRKINEDLGDWGICEDKSRNEGAVKGAVEEFFKKEGIVISVTYEEKGLPDWMVQKPLC